jgi:ABC-type bacteriocin/lantibiotic exporter with double-glycine peptidase domain
VSNRAELYRAEGVSFSLKGRRLLNIGSLLIGEGGIYCLAGPNGAGKTLLLSLLAGLIVPDRGTVSYGGLEMDAGVRDRIMGTEVTMVHQHPFLFRGNACWNRWGSLASPAEDPTAFPRGRGRGRLSPGLSAAAPAPSCSTNRRLS